MSGICCFLVCQHFQREIANAIAAEGWQDVTYATYPSRCGRPPMRWDELRPLLPESCTSVVVLGRVCVQALTDAPPDFPPVRVVHLSQCFDLVANAELVAELIAQGSYLITPGWLEHWRDRLADLGFSPDNAAEFFHEFARQLVLLDTGMLPEAPAYLAELAEAVGLPAVRVAVGIDHTRLLLTRHVAEWRLDKERQGAQVKDQQYSRQLADHVLAMELLARLARTLQEAEIITAIEEFFRMLFAPEELHYLRVENGLPVSDRIIPSSCLAQLQALHEDYRWTDSGAGFLLRIVRDGQVLGLILLDRLAFPAYRDHYLNLALAMTGVCALAIDNARNRRKLIEAEKMASLSFLVAGVAHGINTPLGVGLTAISTLQRESQNLARRFAERSMTQSDLQTYLDMTQTTTCLIDSNLARIGRLIDTFRQVAVYGKHLPKSRFRLKECIEEVIRSLGERLSAQIPIYIECDETLEIESQADDWHSIFVNLIGNSLRHGFAGREQGRIDIKIKSNGKQLRLDYFDDGNGIASAVLAHIFDPFFTTDLQHGMGLGLHLVYNLITHRMDGNIVCDSQVGHGVHFQMEIPLL